MGAKNQTPKNPWTNIITPKKSHAEFLSHKNFQKALNDVTQKIETLVMEYFQHTIWSKNLFHIW